MSKFIGRIEELGSLKELINKSSASLIVIKGRMRIGKSRLLEEFSRFFPNAFVFSGLPPATDDDKEVITAQSQRDEFARQMHRQIKAAEINMADWGDLFWSLAQYVKQGKVLNFSNVIDFGRFLKADERCYWRARRDSNSRPPGSKPVWSKY